MGTYVMVARARASAVFYPRDSFSMNYVAQDSGPFSLRFGTTTYEAGFEVPIPRDVWVEAMPTLYRMS